MPKHKFNKILIISFLLEICLKQNSTNQQINDHIENGLDPTQITNIEPWSLPNKAERKANRASRSDLSTDRATTSLEETTANVNTGTLAQRYVKAKNSIDASDNFLLQLYMDEILSVLKGNLLTAVDVLNRFPGAQLIVKTLFLFDCPQPPLISPSILDFINDIEIPFCRRIDDITLPVIRNPLEWLPKRKDIAGAFLLGPKYSFTASFDFRSIQTNG